MNYETFAFEQTDAPSKLTELASEMPDLCVDVIELDKPLFLTQENRLELPSLKDETREKLKNDGFPESILDSIGSEAEGQIYGNANLEATKVNGKDALIRTDIDYDKVDLFGMTNLERMQDGRAPLDASGRPIELHHIGQKQDSPLAELTCAEHRGNGNDNVLHNKLKESEINREDFGKERQEYWKARAEQIESQS
ncbi:HNH/ENDO VII family nuclease [Paraburkholderia xenovorans]|uniref:HNH/ENDO VII family nuclease n=1 Tax=Paraburkholderia xenovorans TaxID=36873 RepID=UPI0038BA2B4A